MAVAVAKAVSVRTSAYWGLGGLALATRPNDKIGVNDLTTTGVGAVTPPIDLSGINAGSVVEVVFGYLATGGNAESIVWDAAGIGCHFTQADNTLHVGTASFALGYDITTIRSDVHIIATFNGTTFSAYVIVNGVKHDSQLGIAAGTFIFDQILARTGETAATGTLYYIEIASGIGMPVVLEPHPLSIRLKFRLSSTVCPTSRRVRSRLSRRSWTVLLPITSGIKCTIAGHRQSTIPPMRSPGSR
jgi:hypothetical protein